MYMNVVVLGVAVVIAYFTALYIAEPYLSKQTGRLLQYSANLWLTLGGIALLANYHQNQKASAREQAELALRLSEKWGQINEYLARGNENGSLRPLVRMVYGLGDDKVDMQDPSIRLAIDYIIEKCYEMWVLTVGMNINLSSMSTSTNYTEFVPGEKGTKLATDATQPIHILVGSVFVIPEFYLLLKRGKKFYPQAFTEYVNHCISLYRARKNPRTGKLGFVTGDAIYGRAALAGAPQGPLSLKFGRPEY